MGGAGGDALYASECWRQWRVRSVCWRCCEVLDVLELKEVIRCVLLRMLEVMHRVLCMLEAVGGGLCLLEVPERYRM